MGYLCPVCEEPFTDSQQCANHLAVTAILHGQAHERWLSETVDAANGVTDGSVDAADGQDDSAADESTTDAVDSWESVPRDELAELVAEHANETTEHEHPGDHTHPADCTQSTQPPASGVDRSTGGPAARPAITESTAAVDGLDADAQAILREARELTDRMAQRGVDESEDS